MCCYLGQMLLIKLIGFVINYNLECKIIPNLVPGNYQTKSKNQMFSSSCFCTQVSNYVAKIQDLFENFMQASTK